MPSVKFNIEVNGSELSRSLSTAESKIGSVGSAADKLNIRLNNAAGAAQSLSGTLGDRNMTQGPKTLADSFSSAADRIIAARKATEAQTRALKEASKAAQDLERRRERYAKQEQKIAALTGRSSGRALTGGTGGGLGSMLPGGGGGLGGMLPGGGLGGVGSVIKGAGPAAAAAAIGYGVKEGAKTAIVEGEKRSTDARIANTIFGEGAGSFLKSDADRFSQKFAYSADAYRDQLNQFGRGGMGYDKTQKLLESYIVAFQGDTEKVNSAIENSLETLSTGVVTEEFMTKMEESGLAIRKALREKYNVNDQELQKMISSGAITFDEITQEIQNMTAEGSVARKTFEELSGSSKSVFTKISEGWKSFLGRIGEDINKLLEGPLKKFAEYVNPMNWIKEPEMEYAKTDSYDPLDPTSIKYDPLNAEALKRSADAKLAAAAAQAGAVSTDELLSTYSRRKGSAAISEDRLADVQERLAQAAEIDRRLRQAEAARSDLLRLGLDPDQLTESMLTDYLARNGGGDFARIRDLSGKGYALGTALEGTDASSTYSARLAALRLQRDRLTAGITRDEASAASAANEAQQRSAEQQRLEAEKAAAEQRARDAEARERAASAAETKRRTLESQGLESLRLSGDSEAYAAKRREIEFNNNYNSLLNAGLSEEDARQLAARQAAISSLSSNPGDDNRNPFRSAQRVGTSLASVGGGRSVNVIQAQQVSYAKKSAVSLEQLVKTTDEILSTTKATRYATVS